MMDWKIKHDIGEDHEHEEDEDSEDEEVVEGY